MALFNLHPAVVAHRGASAYAPENTMSAFIKAAQLGVKWVEFDVIQAACGEVVVFHDETLDRTTNGTGNVWDYPYAYLRTLDAGTWFSPAFTGERIPTLLEVVAFLHEMQISANVELKAQPGHEEALVIRVLAELQPYLQTHNHHFLFSSFSFDALRLIHRYAPTCQIGVLLHAWVPTWEEIGEEVNCVSYHIYEDILTREAATAIKQLNKSLLSYTVNEPTLAKSFYSWGVDAVFSDVPDRIMRLARV